MQEKLGNVHFTNILLGIIILMLTVFFIDQKLNVKNDHSDHSYSFWKPDASQENNHAREKNDVSVESGNNIQEYSAEGMQLKYVSMAEAEKILKNKKIHDKNTMKKCEASNYSSELCKAIKAVLMRNNSKELRQY